MKEVSPKMIKVGLTLLFLLCVFICIFLAYYYVLPALKGILGFIVPIALPFVLGLVLAALIDPLVDYLEFRWKINRGLGTLAVLIIVVGGLLVGIGWLFTRLTMELINFSGYLPRLSMEITKNIQQLVNKTSAFYFSLDIPEEIIQNVIDYIQKLVRQASDWVGQLFSSIVTVIAFIPEGILLLIFTLMVAFFFCRDKEKIKRGIAQLLPQHIAKLIESIGREMGAAIVGIIRAQLILMIITFFQTLIGFYVLGIEYSLLLACLVGLVDALPILGPGAVFVPWIIWELLIGNIRLAIGLFILYVLVSVVRQLLQPKIVGDSVGMHPLEALLALYGGLQAFGVLGLFLGPAVLVTIKAIWRGWKK